MDKKRYTVTPKQTAEGIDYVIYDTLLGAEVGFFETQKWAESIAGVMEKEWEEKEKNERGRIRKDRKVSERKDKSSKQGGSRD